MPICVHCDNVSKQFGDQLALDGVTWTVPTGCLAGLLGASGAGKTTLLRIVAGLEPCSAGSVIGPASQGSTGPRRTAIGMVFQNLGLWPHLTARQHVRCVLPTMGRSERAERTERVLRETRLPPNLWDRRPAELSGGELQRLALARALATDPKLLLLDEPLAQIDVTLRSELLGLIRDVAAARNATVIHVTHSWYEVAELCDRLAVLVAGRLEQEGSLQEVVQRPATAEIARLTGPVVELPRALLEGGRVRCHAEPPPLADGGRLLVRPQQIRFGEVAGHNVWTVEDACPLGNGWRISLRSDSNLLTVTAASYAAPQTMVGLVIV